MNNKENLEDFNIPLNKQPQRVEKIKAQKDFINYNKLSE